MNIVKIGYWKENTSNKSQSRMQPEDNVRKRKTMEEKKKYLL